MKIKSGLVVALCMAGLTGHGFSRMMSRTVAPYGGAFLEQQRVSVVSIERQFSGLIRQVNRQNKTITIEDQHLGKEILQIGPETRFLRGKDAAAWEQLREGEQVRAIARRVGGISRALSVEIAR